ncbi:PAP18 [Symbiodinium natans]|uniref:PAP18 protein n=1 Tax=Symbiodinium natans TaxID=878477 RepID=A0A812SX46_9DINO|nr:PAP18 [Symbiodinium natans]
MSWFPLFFCWTVSRGVWSAFRQGSFGIGDLKIMNSTHSFFTWKRNACFDKGEADFDAAHCSTEGDNSAKSLVSDDSSWIIRDTGKCKKQA